MTKQLVIVCGLILLITSCKTIYIQQIPQSTTTQKVALGSVGLDKDFILQTGFNNTAVPVYLKPIKVSASVIPFTKQSYKAFLKAQSSQSALVKVNYIDSLKIKPKFVQLQIADKVILIEALNEKENIEIKDYLSHNNSGNIITSVSIAFNKKDLELIQQADALFLIEKGLKNYTLQLYKNGAKTETMSFNQGVVFAYKTENCCWLENSKYQLNIIDLVSEFNNCPNKTYRSATRAKKKINYFKL